MKKKDKSGNTYVSVAISEEEFKELKSVIERDTKENGWPFKPSVPKYVRWLIQMALLKKKEEDK